MDQFKPQLLKTYLINMGTPYTNHLVDVQARQLLGYLTDAKIIATLSAITGQVNLDWSDQALLPLYLNLRAVLDVAAKATRTEANRATPGLVLALLNQLASCLAEDFAHPPVYPEKRHDPNARKAFRDAWIHQAHKKNGDLYPLTNAQLHLLASSIDRLHLQSIECSQVARLQEQNVLLFADQPAFSRLMINHILDLVPSPLDRTRIYAMVVQASVDESVVIDQESQRPCAPLSFSLNVGALIKDFLLTGIAPHLGATPWKRLWISFYEDVHPAGDVRPSSVSNTDLLHEAPVNYSNFKLHPFMAVDLARFQRFIDGLQTLPGTYQRALNHHWDNDRITQWVAQSESRLQAEAVLKVADGTLAFSDYEFIRQATHAPAAGHLFAVFLSDRATFARYPLNHAFIITHATASALEDEQYQGHILYYMPATGLETFDSREALADRLLQAFSSAEERPHLFACLARSDRYALGKTWQRNPGQITIGFTPITTEVFNQRADARLQTQQADLQWAYDNGQAHLQNLGLNAHMLHLDKIGRLPSPFDGAALIERRNRQLIGALPDKALADAWNAAQFALSGQVPSALQSACIDLPPQQDQALNDEQRWNLLQEQLSSAATTLAMSCVLQRSGHYFAEYAVSATLSMVILQKIYRHLIHPKAQWQIPDSRRYKSFVLEQQLTRQVGRTEARRQADLISINWLKADNASPYAADCTTRELALARALGAALAADTLHTLIDGGTQRPDVDALCRYLDTPLMYFSAAAPSRADPYLLTHNLFHELMMDLPGFHRLEQALMDKAGHHAIADHAGLRNALALSVISDYLYPVETQQPGMICDFNLSTVALGERPLHEVREQLRKYLAQRFPGTTVRGAQAMLFNVLARRYAPYLLVEQIPAQLDHGNSLAAVEFRNAVALAEIIWPGSSLRQAYPQLMKSYAGLPDEGLSDDQKLAIAVIQQPAVLHLAMCHGKIPETPIAQVSHPDTLLAIAHYKEQQALLAKTLTALTQTPPVRKEMALAQLKSHAGLDLHTKKTFTDSQVLKYFVKGYWSLGEGMRMSTLERYMTCGTEREFDEQVLGFDPEIAGGCTLQKKFDDQYQAFKKDIQQGMVNRMTMALNSLPDVDRQRILNAYKFIRVTLPHGGKQQPACFGLIALYQTATEAFAYEVFCPSGTIRRLPQTGTRTIRIHARFSPPSADYLGHVSNDLKNVPGLDKGAYLHGTPDNDYAEPALEVVFYTIARQIRTLSRDEKIRTLCQKMVDEVFGNAVEQAYDVLREPTPYEKYRENLSEKTDQLGSLVLPGYSIYRDIRDGKVTVGTIIVGSLEALSFLVPFGSALVHAIKTYVHIGRMVVRVTSFGVSQLALRSAQSAYALKNFTVELAKGLAWAANPLGPAVFLFQGGVKGLAFLRASRNFARRHLSGAHRLAGELNPGLLIHRSMDAAQLQIIKLPGLVSTHDALKFVQLDTTVARNALSIPHQTQLIAHGVDLSTVTPLLNFYTKGGKNYIHMQGNFYEIRKPPGDQRWHIHTDTRQGPAVRFNPTRKAWEVAC